MKSHLLACLCCSITFFAGEMSFADAPVKLRRGKLIVTAKARACDINVTVSADHVVVAMGDDAEAFDAADVNKLVIRTRGGKDNVSVTMPTGDLAIAAIGTLDLDLDTSGGDDNVVVTGVWNNVRVETNGGDDNVVFTDVTICGETIIKTGSGKDTITVGSHASDSDIDPEPYVVSAFFEGDVTMSLGTGDDHFIVLSAQFGPFEDDDITSGCSMVPDVTINGNGGDDCYLLCVVNIDVEETLQGFETECDPVEGE